MDPEKFRIYLRALEMEDYKKTYEWRKDPVYQAGVGSMKRFASSETEKRWVETVISRHEKTQEVRLAIVLKSNNEMIGLQSLTSIDLINKNAVINSWIGDKKHRKKGYIKEARYLILMYGFQELGLERISSHILEGNMASRKAGEKIGYIQEGVLRNAVFKDGKFHNLIAYSILKSEFYEKFNL
jgi:RimJ/RimL family protein N-acetyltransferase